MKLTLADLNAGISWWLTEKVKNNWPRDFHNSDYYEIYEIRKDGLTHDWWRSTVDRLWDWRAIRSRIVPNTKAEIERRGIRVLERMNELYSGLLASANREPTFLDFDWPQLADFYHLLAHIKGSNSSVFPSKLGHFIFPKLFVITDNEATNAQSYDVFWSSMKLAWSDFDEKQRAMVILRSQIAQHVKEVHQNFPIEIKVIELCSIGRKHKTIDEIMMKPNSPRPNTLHRPDASKAGEAMTQIQSKGKVTSKSSHYANGLEQVTVDVRKADAQGLPFEENTTRIPITLLIATDSYRAGLKFDRGTQTVYICPDLFDIENEKTNLATIFRNKHGFQKNDKVWLTNEQSRTIRLSRRFVD